MNPIIINAHKLLIRLVETDIERDYISNDFIETKIDLTPYEINDAINYLEGQGAIEVLRACGTAPYDFLSVRIETPGRILYHHIKDKIYKKEGQHKIKVLILSANPLDTPKLRLDEEVREITSKIRASKFRDSIELVSEWAVRPDDILKALNEVRPEIVHFCGHGSSSGEIIVVDSTGSPKPISNEAIRSLFETMKDNIKIVLINACYSRTQAESIVNVIDCAIGMNTSIGDLAAITFAAAFYRAIGFGRSVQEAFYQGRTAMLLEGISEENTPELLVKSGIDPAQIRLIEGE